MPVDETRGLNAVFMPKSSGNYWVSTVLSTGLSGITSGSIIDVRGLTNITAYIQRTVSTTAVELEASPDGSNWYNWETFSDGAIPAAGEVASQDVMVSGATVGYVRAIPNVSATFTSACIVHLNGQTR